MKKRIVLAAITSVVALAGVPAASAAGVAPANGNDVILPNGDVYQLGDDGVYQLIPDVATGDAMNLDWNALTPVDELDADVGSAFPDVG